MALLFRFFQRAIFLCSIFAALELRARPPEDLILLPAPKEAGMRVLRNKNITFTNEEPTAKKAVSPVPVKFAVKGRTRPERGGKVLSQISQGSWVTPFRISRDGRWIAVIVKSSGIRVWVPRSSLPALDSNLNVVAEPEAPKSKKSDRELKIPEPDEIKDPDSDEDFGEE